ncbi:hypothetical protein BC830DRAFT_1158815 [Chytriomyces sp. MP71]|nr:hypothetical protein BC830DRAFT_1158815 [Chytriomyces sp. MP71]
MRKEQEAKAAAEAAQLEEEGLASEKVVKNNPPPYIERDVPVIVVACSSDVRSYEITDADFNVTIADVPVSADTFTVIRKAKDWIAKEYYDGKAPNGIIYVTNRVTEDVKAECSHLYADLISTTFDENLVKYVQHNEDTSARETIKELVIYILGSPAFSTSPSSSMSEIEKLRLEVERLSHRLAMDKPLPAIVVEQPPSKFPLFGFGKRIKYSLGNQFGQPGQNRNKKTPTEVNGMYSNADAVSEPRDSGQTMSVLERAEQSRQNNMIGNFKIELGRTQNKDSFASAVDRTFQVVANDLKSITSGDASSLIRHKTVMFGTSEELSNLQVEYMKSVIEKYLQMGERAKLQTKSEMLDISVSQTVTLRKTMNTCSCSVYFLLSCMQDDEHSRGYLETTRKSAKVLSPVNSTKYQLLMKQIKEVTEGKPRAAIGSVKEK